MEFSVRSTISHVILWCYILEGKRKRNESQDSENKDASKRSFFGSCFIFHVAKTENPTPQSFFAWYLGSKVHMSHSAYQAFPIELLPKSLEISHWLSISVAVNSKIHVCCGRSRNLSVVKSQRYFISERLFFPLCEQQGKITKLMKYITYLLL